MTQQTVKLVTEVFKVTEGHFLTVHQIPAVVDAETGEVAFSMAVVAALDTLKKQAREKELTEMQFDPSLMPEYQAPDPVSHELRRAMLAKGMTGAAIARALGVKPPLVSRWLSSNYHDHNMATIRRIAEVLDMEVEVKLKPRASQAF